MLGERSCSVPQWRCYAKYINSQQILLTFLPASFTGTSWIFTILWFHMYYEQCVQNLRDKRGCYVYVADVLMLMVSGLETEPQSNVNTQEDDTLTPSNKSQADSLSGSISGLERSESGLSMASKLRRSFSNGLFTARSPVLSPQSEGQTGAADSLVLDQQSWDSRVSETESGTPGSGRFNTLIQSCNQKQIGIF